MLEPDFYVMTPVFTKETIDSQTIDQLLDRHPNLMYAVQILISACEQTPDGKIALQEWDKARKVDNENAN